MARITDYADVLPSSALQFLNTRGAQRRSVSQRVSLGNFSSPDYLYCSSAKFDACSDTDKNERCAGRVAYLVEGVPTTGDGAIAPGALIGRIYLEFTPSLRDPIDPTLNG